jgi:hypothetical protein
VSRSTRTQPRRRSRPTLPNQAALPRRSQQTRTIVTRAPPIVLQRCPHHRRR